jgi:hypothetical protein
MCTSFIWLTFRSVATQREKKKERQLERSLVWPSFHQNFGANFNVLLLDTVTNVKTLKENVYQTTGKNEKMRNFN